jgi:hypothetical protein
MMDEVIQVCVYARAGWPLTWRTVQSLPTVTAVEPAPPAAMDTTVPDELTLRTERGPVSLRRLGEAEITLHRSQHLKAQASVAELVDHLTHLKAIWHVSARSRTHLALQRIVDALASDLDGLYLSTWWYHPGGRMIETHRDRRSIDEVLRELRGGFER